MSSGALRITASFLPLPLDLSAQLQLQQFVPSKPLPRPPKLSFSSPDRKIAFQHQCPSAFSFPTHSSSSPPLNIYTDGSCPDQYAVSYADPAGWGVFFSELHLDFFGPVGSLPFPVKRSNNTGELHAPLEAISYLLSFSPPLVIPFHLDSQYVLGLLLGISLPASNISLAFFFLDYYRRLCSVYSHSPQG